MSEGPRRFVYVVVDRRERYEGAPQYVVAFDEHDAASEYWHRAVEITERPNDLLMMEVPMFGSIEEALAWYQRHEASSA